MATTRGNGTPDHIDGHDTDGRDTDGHDTGAARSHLAPHTDVEDAETPPIDTVPLDVVQIAGHLVETVRGDHTVAARRVAARRRGVRQPRLHRLRQTRLFQALSTAERDPVSYRWAGIVLAVLATAWFGYNLGIGTILNGRWPIEGDLVSQNWWLEAWTDRLSRLARFDTPFGWTDDFGGGQPFGYFYFPLPATLYAALHLVLHDGLAVKLLQYGALATVAIGTWQAMRLVDPARRGTRVLLTGTVTLGVFYPHRYPVGADLWSVVIGEYSYAYAAGFAVWFLAVVWTASRGATRWRSTAVLGAAVVCSHANVAVVVAPVAVIVAAIGLAARGTASRGTRLGTLLASAAGIAGLTAFWVMPLIAMRDEVQGNNKLARFPLSYWFEDTAWQIMGLVGGVGLLIGLLRKRPSAALFTIMGVGGIVAHEVLMRRPDVLWGGRAMPFVYMAIAAGIGELAHYCTTLRWRRPVWSVGVVLVVLGVGFGALQYRVATRFDGELVDRYRHTWEGAGRGDVAARQRVDDLVDTLAGLEPGRILYVHGAESYLTYGGQDLNGELLRRLDGAGWGGASTFFHEANRGRFALAYATSAVTQASMRVDASAGVLGIDDFSVGVEMLRQFGVRYYITGQRDTALLARNDERLRFVSQVGSFEDGDDRFFQIYEIDGAGIVEALDRAPGIVDMFALFGETTWEGKAREWLVRSSANPKDLPHLVYDAPLTYDWIGRDTYPVATITDVEVSDEHVSFTVDRVGVPVLVRMGYSPQWQADGADGPFLAAPNTMIVVPTSTRVELTFTPPAAQRQGLALSVATGCLLVIGYLRRHRRGTTDPVALGQ